MTGGRWGNRVLLLLLAGGVLAALGSAIAPAVGLAPPERAVAGIVVDGRTGLPVVGATLRAGAEETASDAGGRFSLGRVKVAAEVEARAPGYEASHRRVEPSGDLHFSLMPRTVAGFVRDSIDGSPIAGARIGWADREEVAGGDGHFVLEYLQPEHSLLVEAPGYRPLSLPYAGEGEIELRLEPNRLQLEVVTGEGARPLEHAEVRFGNSISETDSSGRATLLRLQEGQEITVRARGFNPATLSFVGQDSQRVVLQRRMVRGVVTDAATGDPLARVIVTDGNLKTVVDEDGRYELAGVERGDQLVASVDGYEQTEATIDDRAEVNIAMKRLPRSGGGNRADRLPLGTVRELFVANASFPVAMAFAPDGRLFYNELRTGRVRVVENGVLREEPFYDFAVAGQPETGLLGIAFDPGFAENRYVYFFYTEARDGKQDGDTNGPNRVVRLTEVDGVGTDLVELLELPSGFIHNAGNLHFGPDGKLYVSLGNTDRDGLSQDLQSPAGKILRLNPDATIPEDNPLAGDPQRYGAVYAYGLRNSFDFTFHPVTGELFATENGPGDNDEINLVRPGRNYGWPASGPQNRPGLADPLLAFQEVVAPTGIEFYTGGRIGSWQNDLFYCSYHRGDLRRMVLAAPGYDRVLADQFVAADCRLDLLTGPDGALYFSDVDAIYRIRPADVQGLPAPAESEEAPARATTRGEPRPEPAPRVEPRREPTPGGQAETSEGGPVQQVQAIMDEWSIGLSTVDVKAGRVRFVVRNAGSTVHALGIAGPNVNERTEDFPAGETRVLEVTLAPGSYELNCPVGGHTELGMQASIRVR